MNETIKQLKLETLQRLKEYKQSVESQRQDLLQRKFAERKAKIEEDCNNLDAALAKYRQEKLSAFNAEIAKKQEEVAKKKSMLTEQAKQEVIAEVDNELAILTTEYDKEIAKIEQELK